MRAENQSVEEWERLVEKVPLKRSAEKEEFFAAMDFLISNQYITGEVIALSGGYQLL
jgi:NAD(P)-dependent dehydrogenase (short-subunit alcohol dehydrogenase family)